VAGAAEVSLASLPTPERSRDGKRGEQALGIHEWRLFHVLSVVLFLGNLITGLFWAAHATRTR